MTFSKRCLFIIISLLLLNIASPCAWLKAASPPHKNQSMHTIQVGSFKNQSDAQKELERLQTRDQQAFMRHEAVKNKGMWYRIYVGLFSSKALAEAFADNLMEENLITGFWIKTIDPPYPDFYAGPSEQEKPIITSEKQAETTSEEPPISPSRTTKPKAAPSRATAPQKQEQVKPVEAKPTKVKQKDLSRKKAEGAYESPKIEKEKFAEFSIGIKAGGFLANSKEEIEITDTSVGAPYTYTFSQQYMQAGLVVSCLFMDRYFVSTSLEKSFGTQMEIYQLTLDTGIYFNRIGPITPYANIGLIYGDLKWSKFPMEFDNGLGWKIGVGGFYDISIFQIGVEASYQAIEYKFDVPSNLSITDGAESIDLSGFSVSVLFRYQF